MIRRSGYKFGPGLIVTAAFIGPGTITTCTLAGAEFGYSLLWAVVFSIFATYVLHEMSGRVGLVGGMSLGEAFRRELRGRIMRFAGFFMVVFAVGIGNLALQTGNILGATLGLSALTGLKENVWPLIIGATAFLLLWFGTYRTLEKIFVGFVAMMSLCFIFTAVKIQPDFFSIVEGTMLPRLNNNNFYLALGLVGTTIVPYNFFLYTTVVREKWKNRSGLGAARLDIMTAVIIGGLISMAIIITSSAAFFGTDTRIESAGNMATQLEPLLGTWAKFAIALGLFGAGMSSAMTAPLGAAIAITGIFQWDMRFKSIQFRAVWIAILLSGVFFASIGLQPVSTIIFAQVANGVMIPVAALFLIYIVNNKRLLGEHVNSFKTNIMAGIIIVITLILGGWAIVRLFDYIGF